MSRLHGRRKAQTEEDASRLKLTDEFQDATNLTVSEAKILVEAVVAQRENDAKEAKDPNGVPPMTEVMRKTLDYLNAFARFADPQIAHAAERLLKAVPELEPFERAQLGTLCCEEAEEARTLIPSLTGKIDDNRLQQLLDELSGLRKYQQ